jgi:hypothetical protein
MLSLQEYRDGAVVDERYVHHRAEAACLDGVDARSTEPFAEVVEEATRLFGRGRSDEAGTLSLASVGEEGELGNGEDGPSDVPDAAVHLPLVVGHDPQSCDFLGQPLCFGFAVSLRDADQQQEARAYGGDLVSRDRDGGFLDALEDYAQGL